MYRANSEHLTRDRSGPMNGLLSQNSYRVVQRGYVLIYVCCLVVI